jgi:hypothetical protein
MKELHDLAASEGWKLVTVIDLGTTHPYWSIFGVSMSDLAARQHVLKRAKGASRPHIDVLRLVAQSRIKPTKKRPR